MPIFGDAYIHLTPVHRLLHCSESEEMALHEMEKLKQDLQKEIGQLPLVVINDFYNWGKTVGPVKVFSIAPTTVEELQKVVRAAGKYGLKVWYIQCTFNYFL